MVFDAIKFPEKRTLSTRNRKSIYMLFSTCLLERWLAHRERKKWIYFFESMLCIYRSYSGRQLRNSSKEGDNSLPESWTNRALPARWNRFHLKLGKKVRLFEIKLAFIYSARVVIARPEDLDIENVVSKGQEMNHAIMRGPLLTQNGMFAHLYGADRGQKRDQKL